jgi:hypothetical protein
MSPPHGLVVAFENSVQLTRGESEHDRRMIAIASLSGSGDKPGQNPKSAAPKFMAANFAPIFCIIRCCCAFAGKEVEDTYWSRRSVL